MRAIIDLVLLGILVICTWSGYKKGILMGVGGILAIMVSIYSANLLANVFSYDVVPALKPFVSSYMDRVMTSGDNSVLKEMGWANYDYSIDDLLLRYPERQEEFSALCFTSLGIDSLTAENMSARTQTYAGESGVSVRDATVQILCETVAYVACFILAFLIIIIVLTVIGNLPNLSYKIPHLDLINDIGGAILGLATGLLFCILLVWAMKFLGLVFKNDALASTRIGGWLLQRDVLYDYLNI